MLVKRTVLMLVLATCVASTAKADFFDELAKRDPSKIIWKREGNAPYRKTDPEYAAEPRDFLNKTQFTLRNRTGLPLRIKLSFAVQSTTVNRSFDMLPLVDNGEYQTFVYADVTGFRVRIRGYDPTTNVLRLDKTFAKPTDYSTKEQRIAYFYDVTEKLHVNGLPPVTGPRIGKPSSTNPAATQSNSARAGGLMEKPPLLMLSHFNQSNGRTYTYRVTDNSATGKLRISRPGAIIHEAFHVGNTADYYRFQINYTESIAPQWAIDATHQQRYEVWIPRNSHGRVMFSTDSGSSFLPDSEVPMSGLVKPVTP